MPSPGPWKRTASAESMFTFLHRLLFGLIIACLSFPSPSRAASASALLQGDKQNLLDFKASLPADCLGSWTDWSADVDITKWQGVELENKRVVGVFLYARAPSAPCMNLSPILSKLDKLYLITVVGAKGPLPTAWANLTRLAHLDLSNNQLTGSLPNEWGALTNLEDLNLMNNMLSGNLPPDWSDLTNLQCLRLNNNRFTGTLPTWKEFPLWYLDISSNQLSGTLGASWTTLTEPAATVQTRQYNVSNNKLSGSLTFRWKDVDSSPGLIIDVSANAFQGPIPALPNATLLFNASKNQFSGVLSNDSLPSRLQHLDLASNGLTGSIPGMSSTNLVYVDMGDNFFSQLPDTIAAPKLTFLSIANNQLHGTLPVWEHAQALVFCDLSHNSLTGTIPLPWLQDTWVLLSLHHNQLSGSLPDPMCARTVALLLQDNQMTGCIPSVWEQNDTLVVLNVSNNPLSCQLGLPAQWGSGGSFHNLSVLHISGTHISGAIPESWLSEENLPYLVALGLEADNWWLAARSSTSSQKAICTTDKVYDAMEWYIPESKLIKLNHIIQESIRCLPGSGFESDYVPDADLMDGVVSYASLLENQLLRRVNLHFYGECPPEESMCGIQEAAWLVGVQWGVVGVAIMLMTMVYGILVCVRTRKTNAEVLTTRPSSNGMRKLQFHSPDQLKAEVGAVRAVKTQQVVNPTTTSPATKAPLLSCSPMLKMGLCCPAAFSSGMSPAPGGMDLYSDSDESVTPSWYHTCQKVMPWSSIFQVLLHWLDFGTDVLFLVYVWPKWPAFGLITILLFQHVFATAMLAAQLGQLGHKTAQHVVLLCMPVLPLLDVFMLLTTVCHKWKRLPRPLADLALDWNKLYPMRKVSEVLMESLPAAILQSVVFVLGNSTAAGWFLTIKIYLPAMIMSAIQIILLAAQVLRNAWRDRVSPWKALLDMARSSKARISAHNAYSISSSSTRICNFAYFTSGYAAEMELMEADLERPSPVIMSRPASNDSGSAWDGGAGGFRGIAKAASGGKTGVSGKGAIAAVCAPNKGCSGGKCGGQGGLDGCKLSAALEHDNDGSEASSSGSSS